ncbi:MAG: homoserine dehydrogenase [Tissierellia bacterium]|nr:homoserine dehydrogenase [Tissierellia bacterium]
MINLGLLGCGTVGSGVLEIFKERKEILEKYLGEPIAIKKVLVRNLENYKDRDDFHIFTDDIYSIIDDEEIETIIEVTGNIDKIFPAMLRAMENQKNIVTANKAMISKHMEELIEYANHHDVKFYYDAAVAGAVPIIESIKNIANLNEVKSIKGVLNGTCNFILSSMEEGKDYKSALQEAQDIGFAEADPTDDVEGFDTMRKLRILSTLAFKEKVSEEDISLKGITEISIEDIQALNERGERYKLVASAYKENGKIIAKVEPTIVKKDSVIGGLINGENAIVVEGDNCGKLVFKGPGAGGRPTGFAILTDVLNIYKD